jgi:hypothetical protein
LAADGQKLWKASEKRPYNVALKTLCWHAGQSFMKLAARDDCFYGRIYRERKAFEQRMSDSGQRSDTAKQWLTRVGKHTEAYKHYDAGHLPPSQIDGRARRYAVKMFLSHMNEIWLQKLGLPVPAPFSVAHQGHVDYIPPPIPADAVFEQPPATPPKKPRKSKSNNKPTGKPTGATPPPGEDD